MEALKSATPGFQSQLRCGHRRAGWCRRAPPSSPLKQGSDLPSWQGGKESRRGPPGTWTPLTAREQPLASASSGWAASLMRPDFTKSPIESATKPSPLGDTFVRNGTHGSLESGHGRDDGACSSRAGRPAFSSCLHPQMLMEAWASDRAFLCLSFLPFQRKVRVVPTSWGSVSPLSQWLH